VTVLRSPSTKPEICSADIAMFDVFKENAGTE
jgi:hypothetical protein